MAKVKNRLKIGTILVSGLQNFAVGKPALIYSQTVQYIYKTFSYVLHQGHSYQSPKLYVFNEATWTLRVGAYLLHTIFSDW